MRIVIDLQAAQPEKRYCAIGRYAIYLSQAIAKYRGKHDVFIVLSGFVPEMIESIRAGFDDFIPQEKILVWHGIDPTVSPGLDPQAQCCISELLRDAFILNLQPDVIYVPGILEDYPADIATSIGHLDSLTPACVAAFDNVSTLNAKQSSHKAPTGLPFNRIKNEQRSVIKKLLVISEATRKEIKNTLVFSPDFVTQVSAGAHKNFRPLPISAAEWQLRSLQFDIERPFILCAEFSIEHLCTVMQGYAALPNSLRESNQLVLFGQTTENNFRALRKKAKEFGLAHHEVCFIGPVNETQLLELYNLSTLFVAQSWCDEIGLSVREAMACGAPVIAADSLDMRALLCSKEAIFDSGSAVALSNKIRQVLEDRNFRETLSANSLKRAKKRSWKPIAHQVLATLAAIHANNRESKPIAFGILHEQLIHAIAAKLPPVVGNSNCHLASHIIDAVIQQSPERQLFVDISELCQKDARTGIQRVTRSILQELIRNPPSGFRVLPVFAVTDQPGYRYATQYLASDQDAQEFPTQDQPIRYNAGDIFLGLDLQQWVVCSQTSNLRSMRNDGVKMVFVVYDLLPVLLPQAFPPGTETAHSAWLSVIAEMDMVIGISQAVADEFQQWLKFRAVDRLRPLQLGWFHLGADIINSRPSSGLPEHAMKTLSQLACHTSFLVVGTLEPRKGVTQILDAFERLWAEESTINLVIVGKPGWKVEQLIERLLNHPQKDKRLFWFSGISDEYLEEIYAVSSCLIAASEGEGFGLPLIEAAHHKLPIIARDITVFREVAGEHATYFHGTSASALADCLQNWIRKYNEGKHIRSEGLSWLTWSQSTQQLRNALFDHAPKNCKKIGVKRNMTHLEPSTVTVGNLLEQLTRRLNETNAQARDMEARLNTIEATNEQLRHQLLAEAKAREAYLEQELQQTRHQLEQALANAHHWALQASSSEAQVQALHSSTSWKLTLPLRKSAGALQWLRVLPRRTLGSIVTQVILLVHFVLKRPALKRKINNTLIHYPRLHKRAVIYARRIISLSAARDKSQTQYGSLNHSAYADLDRIGMTPQAQQIYHHLKDAIKKREQA